MTIDLMKTAWRYVRILLLAGGFGVALSSGLASADMDALREISNAEWTTMALGFLLAAPPMLLFVVGVQVINPFTAKVWTVPTHDSNPFRLREPLLFFHFGAHFMFVGGIGYLAAGLWTGPHVIAWGLALIAGSIGTLIGVRLCQLVFRNKLPATG